MIALDFFLYDNRTLSSRWGRDWGIKAATGALAGRADLRSAFDRYCGALPDDQGRLSGFGEAIGGVRSGDGYLLCVTLEGSDSFGRPSWAVFGLWCPNPATLEQVLSAGDPIGSARALLGGETPPSAIEIRPAKVAVRPRRRRRASADPAFWRFETRSTPGKVISLLLGAVQLRDALPNVLGITATSRLSALAGAGFNVVYCHPMDDRADRALARVLNPQEADMEEPGIPPERRPGPASSQDEAPRSSRSSLEWLLWLSIVIVGAGVIFLFMGEIGYETPAAPREAAPQVAGEVPDAEDPSVPEVSFPEERTAEAVLKEMKNRVEECLELDPEALRRSPGYVAVTEIPVLPEYRAEREQVRQAYAALIEIHGRMVKRQKGNFVAYYYDDNGGKVTVTPEMKVQKIKEILGEAPLGGQECKILKNSLGFEFENEGSVVRRWCDVLGRLEKSAVRILSVASRQTESGE